MIQQRHTTKLTVWLLTKAQKRNITTQLENKRSQKIHRASKYTHTFKNPSDNNKKTAKKKKNVRALPSTALSSNCSHPYCNCLVLEGSQVNDPLKLQLHGGVQRGHDQARQQFRHQEGLRRRKHNNTHFWIVVNKCEYETNTLLISSDKSHISNKNRFHQWVGLKKNNVWSRGPVSPPPSCLFRTTCNALSVQPKRRLRSNVTTTKSSLQPLRHFLSRSGRRFVLN